MYKTPAACLIWALLAGFGATAAAKSAAINWYDWESAAFTAARDSNRLIMVNVGHEGCTACRFMENNTFSNDAVIALLNNNFVSIQVDSEMRPDIGERYSDWAWPATAFMLPDGTQVLALRGSLRPKKFIPILEDLLAEHAAGTLSADKREPYVAPATASATPLSELRDRVRAQLDRSFNDEIGGWGRVKVLEYAEPTLQFLLRARLDEDEIARARALKNAYGFAQQTDSVWGGMFYASFNRWGNTVKEKRTESQGAALQIFASALKVTGDDVFREQIDRIDRYLRQHMRGSDGLFFGSQKDVLDTGAPIKIDHYYTLSDAERRSHGLPVTDHATYTDLNARVIEGYVRAFEATGDTALLATALESATALVDSRRTPAGWFMQLKPAAALHDDRRVHVLNVSERPFLRTQAYLGRAFVALYQATADPQWLTLATGIGEVIRDELEDPELGGFYATTADGTEAVIGRRKPLEDNAVAAQFLYLLGVAIKDDGWKLSAERAIRAAAAPAVVKREGRITGNLAVALELLNAGYVEFSVVGEPSDPNAQALLTAGRAVFEPRKIVHIEAPGRYPKRDKAAMYICNDDACSLPIYAERDVAPEAKKFTPAVFAAQLQ